jgi:hypothetical protein
VRTAAVGFGLAFGFLLSWAQPTDPDRIRAMLLLEDPYLYRMLGSAVVVAETCQGDGRAGRRPRERRRAGRYRGWRWLRPPRVPPPRPRRCSRG